MSLDNLVSKTISSRTIQGVALILPPEYEIDHETWDELIQDFNGTRRPCKLAGVIQKFISELNTSRKDFDGVISIGPIVKKDGRYVTDLTFENNRVGLTALYIYTAEDLQLALISEHRGSGGIRHVVMTYIPD